MLKRVYIDNYKCFSNFEFAPGALTLVMGRNGSGKSALFEVLQLLRAFILGDALTDQFSERSRTRWTNRPQQTFELEVDLRGSPALGRPVAGMPACYYKYRLVIDHSDPARPRVLTETLQADAAQVLGFKEQQVRVLSDDGRPREAFPFDGRHSSLGSLPGLSFDPAPADWGSLHLRPVGFREWIFRFHPLTPKLTPEPPRSIGRIDESSPRRDLAFDMSNFAAWYRRVLGEQMEQQHEFDRDLRSLIDGFVSIHFEPTGRATYEMGCKLKAEQPAAELYTIGLHELSDGQRVLATLYALLRFGPARPGDGGQTLWIDEPDNFVSLAEIQPWLIALRERVETGDAFQALITSHHPEVINYLAADCGQVLEREGGGPVRVRTFTADAASGLSPAETIARGWE